MKKTDPFLASQLACVFLSFFLVVKAACAAPIAPKTTTIYFDLPGQSLQSALIEFALQANISIVVDNQLIKGHRSTPIVGSQPVANALGNLLANTPLEYQFQPDSSTYYIRAKILKPTPPPLLSPSDSVIPAPIEEVIVTSTRLPFRYHTIANSQIDGGIAYFDSSRFINILPKQLLEDQQPSELGGLLKYASGITPGDGLADSNDDAFIRGFQRHAIYLDGFRLSDTTGVKILPFNIEQVEVLKGPSTLLYGQAEPGGIVNVVRKSPQAETFLRASLSGGSFGQRSASLDLNLAEPLMADINARLVMSVDEQAESGELDNIHRELVAPSLTWQLGSDTSIDVGYEFQFSRQELGRDFLVLNPSGPFTGATLEQLAAQARPEFSSEFNLYHAELNHSFSTDWQLTAKYFWLNEQRVGVRTSGEVITTTDVLLDRNELGNDFYLLTLGGQVGVPLIFHPQIGDGVFSLGNIRSLYDEEGDETVNNASLRLVGAFDTGSLTHRLAAGADWYRQDIYKKYVIEKRDLLPGQFWSVDELDWAFFEIVDTMLGSTQTRGELTAQEQRLLYDDYGLYLQDNIELNEKWIATLGTRYASIRGDYTDISEYEFTPLQTYNHFSSQAGLVFKPNENHSLFINYSEALRANYRLDDIGSRAADPELSDQVELGVKSQLWNGRLLSSVALFDIDKKNIVDVKVIEGYRTALQAHQQNTRGLDFDITLQASSRLNVMGAFSLIDPKIVSGEDKGKAPALAAKQVASLFAHYRLLTNLDISGGVSYVGERMTYGTGLALDTEENAGEEFFLLDPYTTVDLGLTYHFEFLGSSNQFQLVVNNLFDEHYYTSILGGTRFNPAQGRSIVGKLGFDF